ncbi:MAG: hypothetical protein AB7P31_15195 [Steroidobacteraceae bacterium]
MSGETCSCATCGTPLDPREGPGRPATYCGEPCRRLAEFQIRSLVRRIDRAALELRELQAKARAQVFDSDERRRRVRVLRRWLVEDRAELARLVGAPAPVAPTKAKRRR